MRTWKVAIAFFATFCASAAAQETSNDRVGTTATIRLIVSPAKPSEPALRHTLLPTVRDQKPGNAALLYARAAFLWPSMGDIINEAMLQWLDAPLGQAAPADIGKVLPAPDNVVSELEMAARRRHCIWMLPIEEQGAFSVGLPEVKWQRDFGRLLALQTRWHLEHGRRDEAIHSLQCGFALARHTNEGATLIHTLVAVAVARLASHQLMHVAETPDAPSLYWALADLPRPFLDHRLAIQQEADALYGEIPMLRNLGNAPLTEVETAKLESELLRLFGMADEGPAQTTFKNQEELKAATAKFYTMAKEHLLRKHPKDLIDRMPPLQAVTLYSLDVYERSRDNVYKWLALPYWHGHEGLAKATEAVTNLKEREGLPLGSLLLPAVNRVYGAVVATDRHLALLQCIEAIRIYANDHEGKLPQRLSDLDLPVLDDPVTGEPFVYSVKDDTAIFDLGEAGAGIYSKHYEITIRR